MSTEPNDDWSFARLLRHHLYVVGNRPGNRRNDPWKPVDFAYRCDRVTPRSVSNWCSGRALPTDLTKIVELLFGGDDRYEPDRQRLRAAFLRDREADRAAGGATRKARTEKYIGTQAQSDHPQTAAIFSALEKAQGGISRGQPGPISLQFWDFRPPHTFTADLVKQQKLRLYGGISSSTPIRFTSLDYVVSGLPFRRDVTNEVLSKIISSTDYFSSYTITARPGQGSTTALAQVVLDLLRYEGFITLWSFDHSRGFLCEKSISSISKLYGVLDESGKRPDRLIFVFDGLSDRRRTEDQVENIVEFQRWCHEYAISEKRRITFLFSSSRSDFVLSDPPSVFNISLSASEEESLYKRITEEEPRIRRKLYETAEDILHNIPAKRHYKDDVQSFTHFLIENSLPVYGLEIEWFADTQPEPEHVRHLIEIIAVFQLLDLPLPEALAKACLLSEEGPHERLNGPLERVSPRIAKHRTSDGKDWEGVVLSSPSHAASLLRRSGKLNEDFITSVLDRLIEASLLASELNAHDWKAFESEFIRHIFQRMTKRQFYFLIEQEAKDRIAQGLFLKHGLRLRNAVMQTSDTVALSKWAGTFSSFLPSRALAECTASPKNIVLALCARVLKSQRVHIEEIAFVPLLRAIKRLPRFFPDDEAVTALVSAAHHQLDLDAALNSVLLRDDAEVDHRANEVLLSYIEFMQHIKHWDQPKRMAKTYETYLKMEKKLASHGIRLDAANYLGWARSVWIDKKRLLPRQIEERGRYLTEALRSLRYNVRGQGTWKPHVDKEVAKFKASFRTMRVDPSQGDPQQEDGDASIH